MTENDHGMFSGIEKINPRLMAKSFTGFDELAIQKAFGETWLSLEGTLPGRAMLFVQLRRGGVKDAAAYRAAMEVTTGDMDALFVPSDDPDAEGNGDGSTSTPTTSEPVPTQTS